ncbi:hypothetical protein E2320_007034, partial [Naja naja]
MEPRHHAPPTMFSLSLPPSLHFLSLTHTYTLSPTILPIASQAVIKRETTPCILVVAMKPCYPGEMVVVLLLIGTVPEKWLFTMLLRPDQIQGIVLFLIIFPRYPQQTCSQGRKKCIWLAFGNRKQIKLACSYLSLDLEPSTHELQWFFLSILYSLDMDRAVVHPTACSIMVRASSNSDEQPAHSLSSKRGCSLQKDPRQIQARKSSPLPPSVDGSIYKHNNVHNVETLKETKKKRGWEEIKTIPHGTECTIQRRDAFSHSRGPSLAFDLWGSCQGESGCRDFTHFNPESPNDSFWWGSPNIFCGPLSFKFDCLRLRGVNEGKKDRSHGELFSPPLLKNVETHFLKRQDFVHIKEINYCSVSSPGMPRRTESYNASPKKTKGNISQ